MILIRKAPSCGRATTSLMTSKIGRKTSPTCATTPVTSPVRRGHRPFASLCHTWGLLFCSPSVSLARCLACLSFCKGSLYKKEFCGLIASRRVTGWALLKNDVGPCPCWCPPREEFSCGRLTVFSLFVRDAAEWRIFLSCIPHGRARQG